MIKTLKNGCFSKIDAFLGKVAGGKMKKRIIEMLKFKEVQLQEIWKLQKTETKKSKLNDLDKNEIETKAQILILQHLLSESVTKN
jgi:hypothetical protein